jgi:hypothetical protein
MTPVRKAAATPVPTPRADGKVEIMHIPDLDGSAIALGRGVLLTAHECGWVSADRARALVAAERAVYVTRAQAVDGMVWIHRSAGAVSGVELGDGLGTIEPGQTRRVPVAIARRVAAVGRVTYAKAPPNAARR